MAGLDRSQREEFRIPTDESDAGRIRPQTFGCVHSGSAIGGDQEFRKRDTSLIQNDGHVLLTPDSNQVIYYHW